MLLALRKGYPKIGVALCLSTGVINFSVLLPSGEFSALCRNTKKLETLLVREMKYELMPGVEEEF